MVKLIDRQLIRAFFKGYLVCLTSLLSLYIVVDVFTNLDEFGRHSEGLSETVRRLAVYYGAKITQIFDRLFEAILLMAAMFTVAVFQRNNEQLPLLSAGVSTRRIVAPVLVSAGLMLTLMIYNQEMVIPTFADQLANQRDDPDGEKHIGVRGAYEPNGIHIVGLTATRADKTVHQFCVTIPEKLLGALVHLEAKEAHYVPPGPEPRSGGWELNQTTSFPESFDTKGSEVLEEIDKGKYFLQTEQVHFESITRKQKWYLHASTQQLYDDLQRPDSERLSAKAVLFHMRFTRPILSLILVLMGLSVILRDQNRSVLISAGMCLVTCVIFFAATYLCKMLGDYDIVPPAFAAWLPVLIFGPFALVRFDAVHT